MAIGNPKRPLREPKDDSDKPAREGRTCQWPIGDPSTSDFHFCGAKRMPARPYCAEHIQMAYHTEAKRPLRRSPSGLVRPAAGSQGQARRLK